MRLYSLGAERACIQEKVKLLEDTFHYNRYLHRNNIAKERFYLCVY